MSRRVCGVAIAAILIAGGCGGGGSPSGPSGGGSGGGGGGGGGAVTSGATITIGANGAVSPSSVTISVGQGVTFVNNHNRSHDMSSDPHPDHTDCFAMNTIGRVSPGQTKASTTGFTQARTCGFHDHDDPDNRALKGSITVR